MAGFYTAALSKSQALHWPGLSPPSTRPPLDDEKVASIRRSLAKGVSINATAKKLKVGVATVHRLKQQMALAA